MKDILDLDNTKEIFAFACSVLVGVFNIDI